MIDSPMAAIAEALMRVHVIKSARAAGIEAGHLRGSAAG
jgi:hypothetical protein